MATDPSTTTHVEWRNPDTLPTPHDVLTYRDQVEHARWKDLRKLVGQALVEMQGEVKEIYIGPAYLGHTKRLIQELLKLGWDVSYETKASVLTIKIPELAHASS